MITEHQANWNRERLSKILEEFRASTARNHKPRKPNKSPIDSPFFPKKDDHDDGTSGSIPVKLDYGKEDALELEMLWRSKLRPSQEVDDVWTAGPQCLPVPS